MKLYNRKQTPNCDKVSLSLKQLNELRSLGLQHTSNVTKKQFDTKREASGWVRKQKDVINYCVRQNHFTKKYKVVYVKAVRR